MKYCTYCGSAMDDNANYCPNCGAEAYDAGMEKVITEEPEDLDVGYRVVLFSRGDCSLKVTKEVLSDLLGYSTTTVEDLLDNMPVEVADELTELQALTIAQVLAEYGMEVTVVDEEDNYVDLSDKAETSVFDSKGSMLESTLMVLATLSAYNRVHRYRRYRRPSLLSLLFRPRYRRPPFVHVRRHINRDPEPRKRIVIQKPTYTHRPSYNTWSSSSHPSHHTKPQGSSNMFSNTKPQNKPSGSKPQGGSNLFGSSKPSASKPSSSSKPSISHKPSGFSNKVQTNHKAGSIGSHKAPTGRSGKK
ncbi:MAG: zinc ribbon domain-containing protein [Erysipelotrichaceae bacterium]|nr:zinc ribbon domain-containing protein [Erysipelotrichaceae bacterium]